MVLIKIRMTRKYLFNKNYIYKILDIHKKYYFNRIKRNFNKLNYEVSFRKSISCEHHLQIEQMEF
jgi:hypothetical protein